MIHKPNLTNIKQILKLSQLDANEWIKEKYQNLI